MAEAAGGETGALNFKPSAKTVLRFDLNIHRPLYKAVLPRHAEAALGAILFAGRLNDFGIDKLNNLLFFILRDICLDNENRSAEYAHLRSRQADPIGLGERFPHIVKKLVQPPVELRDRAAFFAERRLVAGQNVAQCHILLRSAAKRLFSNLLGRCQQRRKRL